MRIDGEKIFTEDEIKNRFESKETKIFNKTQFENDLNTIRAMYSEKGYIFAQSKDAYDFDDEAGEVAINLNIEEGTVAYVNKIKIRGNYVTKDKVILRELKVVEGEAFDSNKIRKSQENLYNLGFFDGIVLDTEQVDIDKLNIVFEVKERKTGTISLGAGYSSVEGLVGYVQLAQNNLFGEGKVFSADVQVGNQKQSWQLGYKDPWLFDTPTSLDTSIWNTNKQQGYNNQGYELDSYGFSLGGGRRLTDEHKVYLTYQYEKDKYLNVTDALKPYITKPESQVSSITPMYVFDTRDDVFDPGRGIYQNLSMQLAGGILGGDSNYIKALWDGRVFVPSFWKFVLGFHIKVGNAWGYNWQHYGDSNVPLTEKFYCGGTDTVRGYEERGLGPAEGGNFTIVTNIEYKLRLIDRVLSLVTFYDSGNSWKSVKDVDWQNPYLYPSAGAGVRFTIPGTVMMIRLDWGYALDPGKRVNGGKIHFNIGNIF